LNLRQMTNQELLDLYDSDLALRLHNAKNLRDTRVTLQRFMALLRGLPPSADMAKAFLSRYADRNPYTLYRYTHMIKSFMKWYGEPLDDVQIRIPRKLPAYTADSDIEKLIVAASTKKTHKKCIQRDSLIIDLALRTGLRRMELANLRPRDVFGDHLIVREGKYKKDRMVPLTPDIARRLTDYVRDLDRDRPIFGLAPASITNKVKIFAKKAGLNDLHLHSLRHKYATDLLESGADLKSVQALMGHQNLNTTEVYLSLTNERLFEAVHRLDQYKAGTRRWNGKEGSPTPYQATHTCTIKPPSGTLRNNFLAQESKVYPFDVNLIGQPVLIESIQVRCSDVDMPYQLMVFESAATGFSTSPEDEDIVRMESVNQRLFTYAPIRPLPYDDRDGVQQLHGGLAVGGRPLRFDLASDPHQSKVYYEAEVRFEITIRYYLSQP
jgi:integrase